MPYGPKPRVLLGGPGMGPNSLACDSLDDLAMGWAGFRGVTLVSYGLLTYCRGALPWGLWLVLNIVGGWLVNGDQVKRAAFDSLDCLAVGESPGRPRHLLVWFLCRLMIRLGSLRSGDRLPSRWLGLRGSSFLVVSVQGLRVR